MDGASWKGLKSQLGAHRSVLQGLICANEEVISDSELLANAVGSEDLDEDKIRQEIEKLKNQNASYQSTISAYGAAKRSLSSNSVGGNTNVNTSRLQYYTQQINSYSNLITGNNQAIQELNNKLQKIEEIEATSQSLYKGSETLYSSVDRSERG